MKNNQTIINLTVNGTERSLLVKNNETLLNILREDLGLTGVKHGCGKGECGACTVIMNGESILSCMTLAVEANGSDITTIEGLAENGELHPLQETFVEEGAIQCGFCTPGMILTAKAFLDKNPHPSREEIRTAINGNICRCTGYARIVNAIDEAAHKNDSGDTQS